jgi:hypothetical protein
MPILSSNENDNSGGTDTASVPERTSVTWAEQVPAGDDDVLAYELPADATVENVRVRIYPGAENTLRVTPQVRTRSNNTFPLLETRGKDYVDGDDDTWQFGVSESVEEGDKIQVRRENTDGQNAHNYRVIVDVDYLGGTGRLASIFGGWS